jgi:hypothetical protein
MPQTVAYGLAVIFGVLSLILLLWRSGPNWWIGVRTPWTYADREIWDKSWVLCGVLLLVTAGAVLFSVMAFVVALVLLILISLLQPIYLYRRKYGTLSFWKDVGWIAYHPAVRCRHCGHLQKLEDDKHLPEAICEACGLICRNPS